MKQYFNLYRVWLLRLPFWAKCIGFLVILALIGTTSYLLRETQQQLYPPGIIMAVIFLLIFLIWLPDPSVPKLFRGLAIIIMEMASFAFTFWQPVISKWLEELITSGKTPTVLQATWISQSPTFVFFALSSICWFFSKVLPDATAMGRKKSKSGEEIMEVDFIKNRDNVCASLIADLMQIDRDTQWSMDDFVPLDAEVEVKTRNGKKRKVVNLLKAIRNADAEMLVVTGEPGAGKSVALRKLCIELYREVKVTNKIPLYINLKEWQVEKKWDEQNPPTVEQLNDFVVNKLQSGNPRNSRFFKDYYNRLYDNGMLFFILDSFDEIPAVLDEKDKSELIRVLSDVIINFLNGRKPSRIKSILASREFRRPMTENVVTTEMEIRPFTESKIKQALDIDKKTTKEIFHKRGDLVPVIRNPLMARLLALYIQTHKGSLPANQSELFDSFIRETLKNCEPRIESLGLTKAEVMDVTIRIAHLMFQEHGLEIGIDELCWNLGYQKTLAVINVLKFSRLGRTSTGDANLFSFSHRRFCEYFAIQQKIRSRDLLTFEDIPADSQWRDALVLYCEVAEEADAKAIALFCWNMIMEIYNPVDKRTIHCMRFLRDAFKGRLECLEEFRGQFGRYILRRISKQETLIVIRLALECIGLAGEKVMLAGIQQAMSMNNEWIQSTALKSCRHLSAISPELTCSLRTYIYGLDTLVFLKQYRELRFSFSLSEAFAKISRDLWLKMAESVLVILFNIFFMACVPIIYIFVFLLLWLMSSLLITLSPRVDIANPGNIVLFLKACIFRMITSRRICIVPAAVFFTISIWSVVMEISEGSAIHSFLPHLDLNGRLFLMISAISFVLPTVSYIPLIRVSIKLVSLKGLFQFFKLEISRMGKVIRFITWKGGGQAFKDIIIAFAITILIIMSGLIMVSILVYMSSFISGAIALFSISLISCLLIVLVRELVKRHKTKAVFKTIDFNNLNDRAVIYESIGKLDGSAFWKKKLVIYIESNVKNATGDWPDLYFLKATSDPVITRLAKLEEKWLGLN